MLWDTTKRICLLLAIWAALRATAAMAADEAADATVEIPTPQYVALMIARDDAVHQELGLSLVQRAQVREAVAAVDPVFWQLRDVPPQQCAEKLESLASRLRAELAAALTAEQLVRYEQLVIQARGAKALTAPDVRERLELSAEQVESITGLVAAAEGNRLDGQKVFALLSPAQQSKLAELFGPRFDLSQITRIGCVAPEVRPVETWINSPPLTLEELRGKVVVVHFWAFGCINCVRNLPHYQAWHERFSPEDLAIIGYHTPETSAEKSLENLRANIRERGIEYPIAMDAEAANWKAWANNMWPSVYLIDRQGQVRSWWYGELNWQGARGEESMRAKIAELIAEE